MQYPLKLHLFGTEACRVKRSWHFGTSRYFNINIQVGDKRLCWGIDMLSCQRLQDLKTSDKRKSKHHIHDIASVLLTDLPMKILYRRYSGKFLLFLCNIKNVIYTWHVKIFVKFIFFFAIGTSFLKTMATNISHMNINYFIIQFLFINLSVSFFPCFHLIFTFVSTL